MESYSDPQILDDLKSFQEEKNNKALRALYKNNYDMVNNFVLKNSGTTAEAKDIFQDGIIIFYNKVKRPDFNIACTIKTYIYSVCKNLWLDRIRQKSNRARILDSQEHVDIQEDDLGLLIQNEKYKLIAQLVNKLSKDCKKVLTYFYYEKNSMKEIAVKMLLSSEAVAKNKKHNCLKNLKKLVHRNKQLYQELI